jgi:hypothetical protein
VINPFWFPSDIKEQAADQAVGAREREETVVDLSHAT